MNPDELDARFAAAVAEAERALLDRGAVEPLFLVAGRDGRAHVVAGEFFTDEAKAASFAVAGLAAVAEHAVLVAHRTEVWMLVGEAPEPGLTPAASDRRREAVLVIAAPRGEDGAVLNRAAAREIVRGGDGSPTGTTVLDIPGEAAPAGRLGNLLPLESPSAALPARPWPAPRSASHGGGPPSPRAERRGGGRGWAGGGASPTAPDGSPPTSCMVASGLTSRNWNGRRLASPRPCPHDLLQPRRVPVRALGVPQGRARPVASGRSAPARTAGSPRPAPP